MRAVVQRVAEGWVDVAGARVGAIGRGLVVLVGLEAADTEADRRWMSEKLPNLRIFEDAGGKMNLSVVDLAAGGAEAGILLVPNFTVAGDARKGRRPSFDNAMRPELAEGEFGRLLESVRGAAAGVRVASGVFRADMRVGLVNDGPVTIWLDSRGGPAGV